MATTLKFRKLHRKSAPLLALPLLLTALTGVGYRLGRTWFSIPDTLATGLMNLHEGRFLGPALVPVYVLLVGLGLGGLVVTGWTMVHRGRPAGKSPQRDQRWLHRLLAPLAGLPLLISAATGMAYRLGRAWFGLSDDGANLLMALHQGSYFGPTGRVVYVLLVGGGLLVLLVTGLQLTPLFRGRGKA